MRHGQARDKVVYLHKACKDLTVDGLVFKKDQTVYVGSGSIQRPFSKSDRSKIHLKMWQNLYCIILKHNLTVEESLKLENALLDISWNAGILNIRKKAYSVHEIKDSEVSKYFYLDELGKVRWNIDVMSGRWRKIFSARKGDNAGYVGKNGYWTVRLNGKTVKLHRVVWVLYNKEDLDTSLVIDHIDRNRSNNHPSNIRATTYSENNKNKKVKLSKLGLSRIRFSEKQELFHVQWTGEDGRKKHKYFCLKPRIKNGLNYEQAYKECLKFAKEFVKLNNLDNNSFK